MEMEIQVLVDGTSTPTPNGTVFVDFDNTFSAVSMDTAQYGLISIAIILYSRSKNWFCGTVRDDRLCYRSNLYVVSGVS